MSDTDDTAYETLTDPKHFSRLLYTNPVCFLATVVTLNASPQLHGDLLAHTDQ